MNSTDKIQATVEFIGDYDLTIPKGTLCVKTDSDYVKACCVLSDGSVYKVWLRRRNHYRWLEEFCSRIRLVAAFSEKTPRTLLQDTWKTALPDWLTDEIVIEEGLLQREIPAGASTSFVDVALRIFLDESVTVQDFGTPQVSPIILSIATNGHWNGAVDRPFLRNCLRDKFEVWKQRARSKWESPFVDALLEDPQALWRDLSIIALLRSYPDKLTEYLLAIDRIEALRGVPAEALQNIPLESSAVELATAQMEMFFHEVVPGMKKRESLLSLISCLSGRLAREFQLLEESLGRVDFGVLPEDIKAIAQLFKNCQGVSRSRLAALKKLVKPERPECTSEARSWDAAKWLKWSLDRYLEFRQWQSTTGTPDSEVEAMARRFSDWYVAEYAAVHQEATLSLVHVLTGWRDAILNDELSVLVIADCVPVNFWEDLKASLSRSGFSLHASGHRFSPLPTCTAVSKPMMITGRWEQTSKQYSVLLEMRSNTDWNARNVRYFGDLKELADFRLKREPTIVVLNFLPTDELLHSDVTQINSTYEEEAHRLFGRLAESLEQVVTNWPGPKDRVGLYVATDHGATRILSSETRTLDSKVVATLFSDSKYRFAEVSDSEASSVPENLWELGYRFKQPFIDGSATYFIPKGHNTAAAAGRKNGFTHGGATPEEVIVPVGIFRLSKPIWKKLAARFLDLRFENGVAVFYVQRLQTISIALQNPNGQPIEVTDVRILTPGGELRKCSRPVVAGGSEGAVSLDCMFRPATKEQSEFNVQIEYSISGEEQSISLPVKATFKSAQNGGFQLKDLI